MDKYQINTAMVTSLFMRRWNLITKKGIENYYKGEEFEKVSVNDDLESMFEDIRIGEEPKKFAFSYFASSLTEDEIKMVETKDSSYMNKFLLGMKADVVSRYTSDSEIVMEASESDSKYALGKCSRATCTIENPLRKYCSLQ